MGEPGLWALSQYFQFYYTISELEQNNSLNSLVVIFDQHWKVDLRNLGGGTSTCCTPPPYRPAFRVKIYFFIYAYISTVQRLY